MYAPLQRILLLSVFNAQQKDGSLQVTIVGVLAHIAASVGTDVFFTRSGVFLFYLGFCGFY